MSFLEPFFANPALAAAGAACATAPIVIHLLNRLRFRRVKFAAMAFLLESDERNRRRLLLEQMLLLAARVAAVLLIAALLGRLLVDPSTLAVVGQTSPTHHVYVLDDSASMRAAGDEGSAFAAAVKAVVGDLEAIDRRGGGDTVTVVTASAGEAVISDRPVDGTLLIESGSKLAALRPTFSEAPLAEAIAAATSRLSDGEARGRRLAVVTDFRRSDWLDRGDVAAALSAADAEGISTEVIAVGSATTGNLAVTGVSGDLGSVAADIPARLGVRVANYGTAAIEGVEISAFRGADRLPVSGTIERIDAGEQAEAFLTMAFPAGEAMTLRFEAAAEGVGDGYRPDDAFYVGLAVPPARRVLIVDGSPETDGAALLADALAPSPGLSGLAPEVVSGREAEERSFGDFSVVFLHDAAGLSAAAVARLREHVGSGGGLGVFVGPTLSAGAASTEGDGGVAALLPAQLAGRKTERPKRPGDDSPDVRFAAEGRFAPFAGPLAEFLREVRITSVAAADARTVPSEADVGAVVVASCPRPDGRADPLIVSGRVGEGRVVAWLTPLDDRWADWAKHFIFVPLMHELTRHLAGEGERGGTVGDLLAADPGGRPLEAFSVETPDGSPAAATFSADESGRGVTVPTERPGRYTLRSGESGGGDEAVASLVVNVPRSESRLEVASADAFLEKLGPDASTSVRTGRAGGAFGPEGGDVTRLLAVCAVALLIGESWLAARLSRHGDRGRRRRSQPRRGR